MPKYQHSDKVLLAKKIENLTEKKEISEIKKIIFDCNPTLKVVKKPTCILMYFHNLNDNTYGVIDKYIKTRLSKESVKRGNDLESAVSSELCLSAGSSVKRRDASINHKYSTKEKNLIRRKKYENQLNFINGTEKETINFEDYSAFNNAKLNKTTQSTDNSETVDDEDNTNIFIKKT